jgi:hypothetical protein
MHIENRAELGLRLLGGVGSDVPLLHIGQQLLWDLCITQYPVGQNTI